MTVLECLERVAKRRMMRVPSPFRGRVRRATLMLTVSAVSWAAQAQPAPEDAVIGTAALPRDLSPWGMYLNADPVVKAVLIGLVFASIVTWTVWFAKSA